jgi:hypothetical protein
MATGPVAEVAFELDGREVVRLFERPYRQPVDFGEEYAPHELVARAFDAKGKLIATARQWINLPRAAAEVEILVEKDSFGKPAAAKLSWASRLGPRPSKVSLTLDGNELVLDEHRRAALPPLDLSNPHVLTADVEFSNDLRSRADLVLGGDLADEAGSELTAVPIIGRSDEPPPAKSLEGRFSAGGKVLHVTSVVREPAVVLMVRDEYFDLAERRKIFSSEGNAFDGQRARNASWHARLGKSDRLEVVWPAPTQVPDRDAWNVLFDSNRIEGSSPSLFDAVMADHRSRHRNASCRYADAVAVAGVRAAASGSRRAVVLLLTESDDDQSLRSADSVRRYLERIHVPLYVWSLGEVEPPARLPASDWGSFEDVSSAGKFQKAVDHVLDDLDRQSVVWLKGSHLPQDIVLMNTGGDGLTIAR